MEAAMILEKLKQKHPQAILGSADRYGQMEIQIDRAKIAEVVKTLWDDSEFAFNMLIDIVSIDYSAYPNYSGDRFGLVYLFKTLNLGHRTQLQVSAPEEDTN